MFLILTDNAPALLDTLNELANALANDKNIAITIQNRKKLKASMTYVDGQLALQADLATAYSKPETDTALALNATESTTCTTTQIDKTLTLKSNKSTHIHQNTRI